MPRSLGVTSLRGIPEGVEHFAVSSRRPCRHRVPVRRRRAGQAALPSGARVSERERSPWPTPTSVRRSDARFIARQPWTRIGLLRALSVEFGSSGLPLRDLVDRLLRAVSDPQRNVLTIQRVLEGSPFGVERYRVFERRPSTLDRFDLPRFVSAPTLHDWLGLPPEWATWFTDFRELEKKRQPPKTQHYQRWWTARRWSIPRLIEAPKSQLRRMQRKLLHELLERVPFHPAAHGGVRGRSAVTHASLHTGRRVVAQFDLADFFPSITFKRVSGFFVALGYSRAVARELAALTTTTTPESLLRLQDGSGGDRVIIHQLVMRLRERHLPQGAPTSPALANHLTFMLDQRLTEAAKSMGLTYSRYVDDLAFSGDVPISLERLERIVESNVISEGFTLRHRKSRLQTNSTRQRVTGLVVNVKPQPGRREFDRFRALLHQQAKTPTLPLAELEGRAEWFSTGSPTRRAKLRRLLDAINFAAASAAAGSAASTAAESRAGADRAR